MSNWSLFLLTLPLASLIFSATSFAQSDYQAIGDSFKSQFHAQLKKNKVPGGAFVIVDNNKIIKMSAYGKRQKGASLNINTDTVFRLASVSKTFAGSLASMLVHENKFEWDDPLRKYMPEFHLADPQMSQQVKLGHLIGQSTGLMPNSYDNILNANGKLEKIIPKFKKLTPMCSPGTCYSYQNIAFSFIQPVIEQQTGDSYASLVEKRIFEPLHMDTASIGMESFMATDNRASPHIKTRSGFKKVKVKPNYYQVEPAAGVNASITDLSKWLMANLGNNPDVLSPSLLADIQTPGVRTSKELRRREWKAYLNDAHYGKGWRVYDFEGEKLIYHAGWVAGYVAEVAYSPRLKVGMAMLLNGESRVIAKLGASFWHSVIRQQAQIAMQKKTSIHTD